MPYSVTPIPFKPPRLLGLSEALTADHYAADYGAAVQKLNALEHSLVAETPSTMSGSECRTVLQEADDTANAVILHEVYFDGLGGADGLGSAAAPADGPLAEALHRDFGGPDAWAGQFASLAADASGDEGWALLIWSARLGKLVNRWAPGNTQPLADGVPVLALDLFKHAYQADFGADVTAYVRTWFDNLHWGRPNQRFELARGKPVCTAANSAPQIRAEDYRAFAETGAEHVLLDICLAEDMAKREDRVPNSVIRPPETIEDWIGDLPEDTPIIAYCVYGFQVSDNAVTQMRQRGLDARKLAGGLAAWHAMGGKTEPLDR